jgi:hypothetical protein
LQIVNFQNRDPLLLLQNPLVQKQTRNRFELQPETLLLDVSNVKVDPLLEMGSAWQQQKRVARHQLQQIRSVQNRRVWRRQYSNLPQSGHVLHEVQVKRRRQKSVVASIQEVQDFVQT